MRPNKTRRRWNVNSMRFLHRLEDWRRHGPLGDGPEAIVTRRLSSLSDLLMTIGRNFMRICVRRFLVGALLAPVCPICLHAQVPAKALTVKMSSAPAVQAPDDVVAKLTDLFHAGKYAEAQRLIPGLMIAYPDDQRLVKAKALLDSLVAPNSSGTAIRAASTGNKSENTVYEYGGIGAAFSVDKDSQLVKLVSVLPNLP